MIEALGIALHAHRRFLYLCMLVAEDHRPVAAQIVDVLITIDIPVQASLGAFGVVGEGAWQRGNRTGVAIDAPRNDFRGALEQLHGALVPISTVAHGCRYTLMRSITAFSPSARG